MGDHAARTEVLDDLRAFADHGWRVRVVALAVPREVSLTGTVRRYLDELREHGAGRASPLEIHDQAYLKGPYALALIRQQLPSVQVQAVDRQARSWPSETRPQQRSPTRTPGP